MTNPNNAIGTNGAFGGRTSVNAFNDVMGALSRGVLSGWACVPNSGLTVSLGGNGTTRDTAIAEDNAGNRTSINNISNSPINVTIGDAPGANSRIDAIVAYVDNPPSGVSTVTDNPGACGLIVVEGTAASTPVVPNDSKIRTAITADGASGTTAYYVVLAYVTMASGTTDITANEISAGVTAQIGDNMVNTSSISDGAITNGKIGNNAVVANNIDFSTFTNIPLDGIIIHTTIQAGYGTIIDVDRVGNLVIASGSFVASSIPSGESQSVVETIPSGYRPVIPTGATSIFVPFNGYGTTASGAWQIYNDGMIRLWSDTNISGTTRFMYSGVWETSDQFPSN